MAQRLLCPPKQLHVGRWLSPFFLSCAVYFLLWSPENQPSWVGALIKCLPILYLVVFLWTVYPSGSYSLLLQGALLCSAVGDSCLIWPEAFLHGERDCVVLFLLDLGGGGRGPGCRG